MTNHATRALTRVLLTAAAAALALAGCASGDARGRTSDFNRWLAEHPVSEAPTSPAPVMEPAPELTVEPELTPEPAPEPTEPELTVAQEQAVGSAQDYLSIMAFSKSGLIEQLLYEGFSQTDADFAVEHITVDWNKQAVKSGQNYLDLMHFSRSGLIEQLEYEGFSTEQATYAVNQLGL